MDYVKTITNEIRVFGPSPTEKWASSTAGQNAMIWGTDNWGYGSENLPKAVAKLVANGLSLSDAWARYMAFIHTTPAGTITVSEDLTSEVLKDGSGYTRLFPGGIADGEDRLTSVFTRVSGPSSSFAAVAAPTTAWSEL